MLRPLSMLMVGLLRAVGVDTAGGDDVVKLHCLAVDACGAVYCSVQLLLLCLMKMKGASLQPCSSSLPQRAAQQQTCACRVIRIGSLASPGSQTGTLSQVGRVDVSQACLAAYSWLDSTALAAHITMHTDSWIWRGWRHPQSQVEP